MRKLIGITLALALLVGVAAVHAQSVTVTNRGQIITVSTMPVGSDRTDARQVFDIQQPIEIGTAALLAPYTNTATATNAPALVAPASPRWFKVYIKGEDTPIAINGWVIDEN